MEIRRRHAGYVCRGKLCRGCHHRQKSLPTTWWTSHRNQPLQIHIVTHLKSKKMRESDHLILITSGKIWAKATHIWLVSMSGDNAANTAKVQGYALCLPTKRTGLPRTSLIMLLPCHEIARSKAPATVPHLNPTHVVHLFHFSTPKRTKKPPCAQQESQCAQRLKERIARKGGLNFYWNF